MPVKTPPPSVTPSMNTTQHDDTDEPAVTDALKHIKNAWVAAIISGCLTLVFTLIAVAGAEILQLNAWNFIDVGLIFGLAFGLYKRSRACAVVLLVYFVLGKIMFIIETGNISGIILSIVFAYFYYQGIVGTFAYHKLTKHP